MSVVLELYTKADIDIAKLLRKIYDKAMEPDVDFDEFKWCTGILLAVHPDISIEPNKSLGGSRGKFSPGVFLGDKAFIAPLNAPQMEEVQDATVQSESQGVDNPLAAGSGMDDEQRGDGN